MDRSVYEAEADVEATHWWFRGRRRLLTHLLRRYPVPKHHWALDAGVGTGANMAVLKNNGFLQAAGIDTNDDAIKFCQEKGSSTISKASLTALPFASDSFNLILAMDVLEHIDDDKQAMAELSRVLRPGGLLIVTVPAFERLWGPQDDLAHHRRRYVMNELQQLIGSGGLEILEAFYFNFLLLVPIWFARKILQAAKVEIRSENDVNNVFLNAILYWIFRLDILAAPHLKLPFGVSILAVARKRH